tara:strand:+ start:2328 stop:2600 length:273 start_codon:yes stop_codon:yes gene_type:complete
MSEVFGNVDVEIMNWPNEYLVHPINKKRLEYAMQNMDKGNIGVARYWINAIDTKPKEDFVHEFEIFVEEYETVQPEERDLFLYPKKGPTQ